MNAPALPERRVAGRPQALALLMSSTLAVMAIILLAPILPQLQTHFASAPGATWLVPLIVTIPSLCQVLFGPVAGYLGDRFGRRRLLLISLALYAAFGVSPMFLDTLNGILVSRVLVGVAEAGVLVLSTALISDYFSGEARARWLGAQAAVSSVSALLIFGIGGLLGSFGWRGPFGLYASSLLMLVIIWRLTWEPAVPLPVIHQTSEPSRLPWRHIGLVCSVTLVASILFYVVQLEASVALAHLGVTSPPKIGLLTAIATVGTPLGTVFFRFNARRPRPLLLMVAFGCFAAGFSGMSLATDYHWLTFAEFIGQLACGIALPTLLTWAVAGLEQAVRGRGIGIWQAIFAIGGVASPPSVTALTIEIGLSGMFATFAIVSGMVAIGCVIVLLASGTHAALKSE